jgi:hypothetical protein
MILWRAEIDLALKYLPADFPHARVILALATDCILPQASSLNNTASSSSSSSVKCGSLPADSILS